MASKKLKWVRFEIEKGDFGFDRLDVLDSLSKEEGGNIRLRAIDNGSYLFFEIKITILEHLPFNSSKTPKHSVQHYRFEGHRFPCYRRVRGEFDFRTGEGYIEVYGWGQHSC